MESSTSLRPLFEESRIFVPDFQRAYSWDTGTNPIKQVNQFLSDLEDYNSSSARTPYYFGHFLFERIDKSYAVIDGQQRLTTIIIFLCALFARLKELHKLDEEEQAIFTAMVKAPAHYRFATVEYDRQFFNDYIIEQSRTNRSGLDTQSAQRIADAFDLFKKYLAGKDEAYIAKMLETLQSAACTTHCITDEAEAAQMFLFQNNRGKEPSNLEVIKAEFMFHIHLHGGEQTKILLDEINERFKKIYRSIAKIEHGINEDIVLIYALRLYFNDLEKESSLETIRTELSKPDSLKFIKSFSQELAASFEYLVLFYGKDTADCFAIYSLIQLGGLGTAMPFILKAYKYSLPQKNIAKLCSAFESLIIRQRIIRGGANMARRLGEVYKKFTEDNKNVSPILDHISENLENADSENWWWAHWNNERFISALNVPIEDRATARFLLWKYENYLKGACAPKGYSPERFDAIKTPELEHIAPQTENPESGYGVYDDDFLKNYINCLGNYLLISGIHNKIIGNKPFAAKWETYEHSYQQREVHAMSKGEDDKLKKWGKMLINERKKKIIAGLIEIYTTQS